MHRHSHITIDDMCSNTCVTSLVLTTTSSLLQRFKDHLEVRSCRNNKVIILFKHNPTALSLHFPFRLLVTSETNVGKCLLSVLSILCMKGILIYSKLQFSAVEIQIQPNLPVNSNYFRFRIWRKRAPGCLRT